MRAHPSRSRAKGAAAPAAGRPRLRAALLGSAWLGALALLAPDPAQAVDGTWTGPGAEWTTGTNWSSSPTFPDNTATFTNNGAPTAVTISSSASINTIQFNAGAPAYAFTIGGGPTTFNINGNGIVNNSAFAPSFTNTRSMFFNNTSTAGNATIITIGSGLLLFFESSTAGSATITNNANLFFVDTSTAGSATITNNNSLRFFNTSTAGSATITNNRTLQFRDTSTAGSATITNNRTLQFRDTSTGGTARFINGAGGIIDLSGLASAGMTAGSIEGAGTISLASKNLAVGGNNLSTTFSGVLQGGGGSLSKTGTGTLILSGNNTYTGGTTISAGAIAVGSNSALGTGALTLDGGTLQAAVNGLNLSNAVKINTTNGTVDTNGNTLTLSGVIADGNGPGALTKIGAGTLTLTNTNGYTGGTFFNAGTLSVAADANLGAATGGLTFNGGILQLTNGGAITLAATRAITLNAGGGNFDLQGNDVTINQAITGAGGLTKSGPGTLILGGANSYGGVTTVNDNGVLAATGGNAIPDTSAVILNNIAALELRASETIGSLASASNNSQVLAGTLANVTLTTGGDNSSTTFAGTISDCNCVQNRTLALTKTGIGTLTLSGINTYSGATTVNDGTLAIAQGGSILSAATVNNGGTFIVNGTSAGVTVNAGGMLGGTGTVGSTTINGGTLSPGNSIGTLTIQGNLVMASAAAYLIEVSPTMADRTNVTGTASLAGTVNAQFAPGSYVVRNYTILHADGGLGGTTFGGLATTNLPANFNASLSYTATDVLLNLTAALGAGVGLGGNQQNVAGAINNFFNSGGALPPSFLAVFGLTGGNLANALTLLSGEAATGAQQGAFQLGSQFLGLMLDPFVDGRGGIAGAGGPALGFAPERSEMPDDIALAYAKITKAPVYKDAPPLAYEPRWSVWGGAFGGYNKTSGDPLVVGSHDLTARTAGFAAGIDYRLAPGTVAGVALAGGGTSWDLAQGLGGGKSDAFQAGVYAATRSGPWYLAAALAFAEHWMSTDRVAPFGSHLTADFDAQSFGGRIESGYRFGTPVAGVTPYAALQAQSFRTPSYRETDVTGGGFALAYNARSGSDTRSELGARFDHAAAVSRDAVLTLRSRLAWAHDRVSDPSLAAVFQALPGASFIVNGAVPAKDAALASAGAELRLANGVTLLGKFDGEFARQAQTYAGTGSIRYTW